MHFTYTITYSIHAAIQDFAIYSYMLFLSYMLFFTPVDVGLHEYVKC